eukprot:3398457-Pleurochrysis_carterae.AAC.2
MRRPLGRAQPPARAPRRVRLPLGVRVCGWRRGCDPAPVRSRTYTPRSVRGSGAGGGTECAELSCVTVQSTRRAPHWGAVAGTRGRRIRRAYPGPTVDGGPASWPLRRAAPAGTCAFPTRACARTATAQPELFRVPLATR